MTDKNLVPALRILDRDIYCEDGVATSVIAQAADEIERLQKALAEICEPKGESDE